MVRIRQFMGDILQVNPHDQGEIKDFVIGFGNQIFLTGNY